MKRLLPILLVFLAAAARAETNAPASMPASNVVANGEFEAAGPTNAAHPVGWDALDGLGVRWETEDGNRFIRMDTRVSEKDYVESCRKAGLDKWVFPNANGGPIAGTYGVSYYSDAFAVPTGQAYRLTFRFRGAGGGKAWVRGYGVLRGEERMLYNAVVNCRGGGPQWKTFSQCFHPTKHTPAVTRCRVMLYAYWPPGVYAFDDITVVPVSDEEWLADHQENE